MKKLMILLSLILALSLGLSACGAKDDDSAKDADKDKAPVSDNLEAEEEEEAATPSSDPLEGRLAKFFVETMASEKYSMKYRYSMDMGGGQMSDIVIELAVKPDAQAFVSDIAGQKSQTLLKDGKIYIIDHANKTILAMKDVSGEAVDADNLSPADFDTSGLTYVGDGKEDFFGVMRDYEEYKLEEESIRYYFDGEKLVGMAINVEGQSIQWLIEKFEKTVDESLFELPTGYEVHEMG